MPEPLTPTNPVRRAGKAALRSSNTGVPSGHENDKEVQVIEGERVVMAASAVERGQDERVGDTAVRPWPSRVLPNILNTDTRPEIRSGTAPTPRSHGARAACVKHAGSRHGVWNLRGATSSPVIEYRTTRRRIPADPGNPLDFAETLTIAQTPPTLTLGASDTFVATSRSPEPGSDGCCFVRP